MEALLRSASIDCSEAWVCLWGWERLLWLFVSFGCDTVTVQVWVQIQCQVTMYWNWPHFILFFLGDYTYLGCCDRTSNLCSWCSFDNQSKLFRDQGTNLASHSSESHSEYRHLICSHINCQLLNVPGSKGHSHWPCLLLPSFTASFVSVRTSIVKIKKASAPNAKIFSFTLRFLFAHSDKSWEGMLRGMFHHFVRSWRFLGTAWAKIGFQAFCSKKKSQTFTEWTQPFQSFRINATIRWGYWVIVVKLQFFSTEYKCVPILENLHLRSESCEDQLLLNVFTSALINNYLKIPTYLVSRSHD